MSNENGDRAIQSGYAVGGPAKDVGATPLDAYCKNCSSYQTRVECSTCGGNVVGTSALRAFSNLPEDDPELNDRERGAEVDSMLFDSVSGFVSGMKF